MPVYYMCCPTAYTHGVALEHDSVALGHPAVCMWIADEAADARAVHVAALKNPHLICDRLSNLWGEPFVL